MTVGVAHGLGTHGGLTTHWLAQVWTVVSPDGQGEVTIILAEAAQEDVVDIQPEMAADLALCPYASTLIAVALEGAMTIELETETTADVELKTETEATISVDTEADNTVELEETGEVDISLGKRKC